MSFASLSEFLAELQDTGELIRISVPVDSSLELAAITDHVGRSSPQGGPALLFEAVRNSTIPVVTNLLGSRSRLCRCLEVTEIDEVAARLDQRIQSEQAGSWLDALKLAPGWGGLSKWASRTVKTAACQQVVRLGRDVNLWDLPVPRSWPGEEHPVITAGQIVLKNPVTKATVSSQSPLVVLGQTELAWYEGKDDQNSIVRFAREASQNIPVAISLGGDPVLTLASSLPSAIDPRMFAGVIRGSSLDVVRCRTSELEVPAASEIIIEGYIDFANAMTTEAVTVARGNGRYVSRHLPLIHVTAVTHRANPVFPALITTAPPGEESWISLAAERIQLPLLKRLVPEIVDIHQPFSGAGRNLLFVSIQKTAAHQARRILHALWGMESFGRTKLIVVVDADQNVQHEDQIWCAVGTNACPNQDFLFADGLARDDDYTSEPNSLASRVGVDATRKLAGESAQAWPVLLRTSDEIAARVRERWSEYGLDERASRNR